MSNINTYNADWLLEQYWRWVRYGSGGGSILGSMVGRGMPSPVITDDEALAINHILCEFKSRMPLIYNATMLFYNHDRNYSVVANNLDVSRPTATSMVQQGVAWMDGKIDDCRSLKRVLTVFGELRREKPSEPANEDPLIVEITKYLRCAS